MMFGKHGHSHDGPGGHNHSHGGGGHGHGHSHGFGGNRDLGFGDDQPSSASSGLDAISKAPMAAMHGGGGGGGGVHPNMMSMMAMMPAHQGAPADGSSAPPQNAMSTTMMMPQMTPQMMEFAKKMFEQRQQLMKEFLDKGGKSNPQAVQELMAKSAQMNAQMVAQLKSSQAADSGGSGGSGAGGSFVPPMPLLPAATMPLSSFDVSSSPSLTATGGNESGGGSGNAANLLSANLNASPLDDLINNRRNGPNKKAKEEEEAKILDAIAHKDYSMLNAVKATQYGVLERVKELIESGQADAHKPDAENVYLLHWAAINNRLDIAKYLLGIGCQVDPIGGELESTPLNWAARSGHVQMCIALIQSGASCQLFDVEGFSTIHLATMFGHSNVVAYLLVKGIDTEMVDRSGITPLMYAAQRVYSRDPAQLLVTFNARLNAQDPKGNTPLHYCVAYNNAHVMEVLLQKGASLDIRNKKGQTPLDFAIDRKKMLAANMLRGYSDQDKNTVPTCLKPVAQNKDIRKMLTQIFPFLILFYLGYTFNLSLTWHYKLVLIAFMWPIAFTFKRLFFDKNVTKYIPIATTLAFMCWLNATWFIYFRPLIFDVTTLPSLLFVVATALSWYNLYKAYKTDPGVLSSNRDQMNKTILQFVEQNEFAIDQFCSACIIRKPLRSKHCADCDRCVAKFDHHCPWVDNCIGQNNLKYFIGFLFWTPITLAFFIYGAFIYFNEVCVGKEVGFDTAKASSFQLVWQFLHCAPWVAFFTVIAVFNVIWITALCVCHLYQALFISLTTNERMNLNRYKHFYDKNGKYHNPFNFGVLQNFIDLFEIRTPCLKPTSVNWKKEHDIQDLLNSRLDKKKDKYAEV